MVIREFTGAFAFLSNFHPAPVELDGVVYPTVEHAYQAAKTTDPEWRARIRACRTPGAAKRMGRMALLRRGWYEMRVAVMRKLVRQKFTRHPEMAKALVATGKAILVEGNRHHDQFWGVDLESMVGVNQLGGILMDLRAELANGRLKNPILLPEVDDDPRVCRGQQAEPPAGPGFRGRAAVPR